MRMITWIALWLMAGVGPWFFGAWEMWWFWPFAVLLGIGLTAMGIRLAVPGGLTCVRPRVFRIGLAAVPFLAYACVRMLSPAVVFMDAERAVLLHATGLGAGLLVAFGLSSVQRRYLSGMLFISLSVMALYGIVNHLAFESLYVLWAPRYEQYAGRASGPFFCPDHFAGAMELLFCMAAGFMLDRHRGMRIRWLAAAAGGLGFLGVLLSKSRGAGFTLLVLAGMMICWGFCQWPPRVRWYWRMIAVPAVLLVLIGVMQFAGTYVERVRTYGGLHTVEVSDAKGTGEQVWERLRRTSRGRMYGGAWRAWKEAPWLGIGPGMHQHLWPRYAATPDGDREAGVWPTLTNHDFHSYEVHSDWLQLLEEYGVAGVVLFLLPFLLVVFELRRGIIYDERNRPRHENESDGDGDFAYWLSGGLALAAMTFHSLGDFNLQMPGTVWLLAVLLAVPLAGTVDQSAPDG